MSHWVVTLVAQWTVAVGKLYFSTGLERVSLSTPFSSGLAESGAAAALPSGRKTMRERMGEVERPRGPKAQLRPSKRAKRASERPDEEAS